MTVKAFYGRISDNPDVPAVDDQIRRGIESLAPGESFAAIYRDDNISAWSGKLRPGFVELLDAALRHEFDTLVVVEWSRLFRDMEEQGMAQAQLARAGVSVRTTTGMQIDLQTAEGRFLANMLGAQSQLESDLKRQRVRASVVRRLLAGQEVDHKPAFGWDIVRDARGKAVGKSINEHQAAIVRQLHQQVLTGKPINSVTKYLNAERIPTMGRGRKWTGTSVRSLLRRTRNAGFTVYGKEEYMLNIPPLVDRATFDAVNAILDANKVGRRDHGRAPAHMLTGRVMTCWCGADIRHKTTKPRGSKVYRWYTCKEVGGHTHRDDADLEHEVAGVMLLRLRQLVDEGRLKGAQVTEIASLNVKRAEIVRRRGVQQVLAEEEGTDVRAALARIRELAKELAEVDRAIEACRMSDSMEQVREFALRAAIEAQESGAHHYYPGAEQGEFYAWLTAQPIEDQRTLVRSVFESIVLNEFGVLAVQFAD